MPAITDAFLRIHLSGKIAPDAAISNASGNTKLARDVTQTFTEPPIMWAFRAIFSAASQTVDPNFLLGTVNPSAAGVRQVETQTVVAAAGATSSGNLALTLTAAAVSGSPLAISVPLTTATHTTAAKIAAACAAKLNATAAVAAEYLATSDGADIILTRTTGLANDATLNLAITAGLGVSADTTSVDTTAGTLGVVIERLGSDGTDAYGKNVPSGVSNLRALSISIPSTSASYVTSDAFGVLNPGDELAIGGAHVEASSDTITANADGCIVDFLAICD